jgi:hypothetical protein
MCYSAMVEQDAKKLGLRFKARIQREVYHDIFMRRLAGEKLYINKGMEIPFLKSKDKEDKEIAQNIKKWHEDEVTRIEAELFKQKKRLNDQLRPERLPRKLRMTSEWLRTKLRRQNEISSGTNLLDSQILILASTPSTM